MVNYAKEKLQNVYIDTEYYQDVKLLTLRQKHTDPDRPTITYYIYEYEKFVEQNDSLIVDLDLYTNI